MKRPSRLILFLFVVALPKHTAAFSNYLLSRSNCLTDLDPEEVIMNHSVQPFDETDDTTMRITVHGHDGKTATTASSSSDTLLQVPSFPVTLKLAVTSDARTDQQAVIDVLEDSQAQFPFGGCENNRRVALASSQETAQLIVNGPTQLLAGWATGHEAVRLTPTLSIVIQQDENESVGDTLGEAAPEQQEAHNNKNNVEPQVAAEQQRDLVQKLLEKQQHENVQHQQQHRPVPKTKTHHQARPPDHPTKQALPELTMSSFGAGAAVMLLAPVLAIVVCLKLSKPKDRTV